MLYVMDLSSAHFSPGKEVTSGIVGSHCLVLMTDFTRASHNYNFSPDADPNGIL